MTKTLAEPNTCTTNSKTSLGILFWPIVIATVACDLLSLCHLLPTHNQYLYRPYMLSMVQFKVFR